MQQMSTIKGIRQLPTKIKCNRCHRAKGKEAFSEKQQTVLRQFMAQMGSCFNPNTAELITCIPCAPQVQNEFKCKRCDKLKCRSSFSKAALRGDLRDEPTCQACTDAIARGEVSSEDATESSEDDNDDDDEEEEEFSHTAPPPSTAEGSRNGAFSGTSSTGSGGVTL
ncbi:Hypothetical protein R9X50_00620900 [Acrodontium crateriforme]|uniref:Stc1 domain-containing protein n=1 Tax=Acrodontium crateriforme TaxID=150365 RepID=A0AAQ3MD32_9PEZI|nr:Hypothetical protein R9X50_00620900 [Acrodontium crateriforme]